MFANESEYKGRPTLELKASADDRYGITFGVVKARLILANLDAIRAFVEKHADEKVAA